MSALTEAQQKLANGLFLVRPAVVPGTRAILDQDAGARWFALVNAALAQVRP